MSNFRQAEMQNGSRRASNAEPTGQLRSQDGQAELDSAQPGLHSSVNAEDSRMQVVHAPDTTQLQTDSSSKRAPEGVDAIMAPQQSGLSRNDQNNSRQERDAQGLSKIAAGADAQLMSGAGEAAESQASALQSRPSGHAASGRRMQDPSASAAEAVCPRAYASDYAQILAAITLHGVDRPSDDLLAELCGSLVAALQVIP